MYGILTLWQLWYCVCWKAKGMLFPNSECCSNNHVFDPYVINELKTNQWALVTLEKTLWVEPEEGKKILFVLFIIQTLWACIDIKNKFYSWLKRKGITICEESGKVRVLVSSASKKIWSAANLTVLLAAIFGRASHIKMQVFEIIKIIIIIISSVLFW